MSKTFDEELREILADHEHRTWGLWQSWLQNVVCKKKPNGDLVIPAHLAERWDRQCQTEYADLPENEKESDRKEAMVIMPHILALIKKHQPEPRDPRRVDAGNESYNDGARGFRMGFTLGAASALADSDKVYGLEEDYSCEICGADPMTPNCNNANCDR